MSTPSITSISPGRAEYVRAVQGDRIVDVPASDVREHLARIEDSAPFRISKRCQRLLHYVIERTIMGSADLIKERSIGVDVFGRAIDYDTANDHVVRTVASEVRKRLAQYYLTSGQDEPFRIELPTGSYVPVLRMVRDAGLETIATHREPDSVPLESISSETTVTGRRRRIVLGTVAAVLTLSAVFLAIQLLPARPNALDQFWAPLLSSKAPVVVCIGNAPGSPADATALIRPVTLGDALGMVDALSFLSTRRHQFKVVTPASTGLSELANAPALFIGGGNNNWSKQVTENLRFGWEMRPHRFIIRDRKDPSSQRWGIDLGPQPVQRDYALIARVFDPRTEQYVVVVGGLSVWGTRRAGSFIADLDSLSKLPSYVWKKRNLEVVISTEVVENSSGPAKIEAVEAW